MKEKLQKLINVYKKYGFFGFCRKLYAYIIANYIDRVSLAVLFRPKHYRALVREMLSEDCERIILWRSSFGYNVPLFQRPQHIAGALSRKNCLVIYEVTTMTDRVRTLKKLSGGLWLFNYNNALLRCILMQELKEASKPEYVHIYSTDWKLSVSDIVDYVNKGFAFIYEYIDHISPEITGTVTLPKDISDKYAYVMSHPETYVVVTADALYRDVVSHRGTGNCAFSPNGVDYEFFTHFENYTVDDEFSALIRKGRPIVCYYGAMAKWFDYELLKRIAQTGKYSVALFGIKYDESYDTELGECENVFFFGPRDYSVLKYYARLCDILMIPFRINDITRSTSPVKLFEYMALHKPIVTTDMDECRKYSSVLIGKTHDDFLEKLSEALCLRESGEYTALLDREARENDWSSRADKILELISKDE